MSIYYNSNNINDFYTYDLIYNSKSEMEGSASEDGVFVGRFVACTADNGIYQKIIVNGVYTYQKVGNMAPVATINEPTSYTPGTTTLTPWYDLIKVGTNDDGEITIQSPLSAFVYGKSLYASSYMVTYKSEGVLQDEDVTAEETFVANEDNLTFSIYGKRYTIYKDFQYENKDYTIENEKCVIIEEDEAPYNEYNGTYQINSIGTGVTINNGETYPINESDDSTHLYKYITIKFDVEGKTVTKEYNLEKGYYTIDDSTKAELSDYGSDKVNITNSETSTTVDINKKYIEYKTDDEETTTLDEEGTVTIVKKLVLAEDVIAQIENPNSVWGIMAREPIYDTTDTTKILKYNIYNLVNRTLDSDGDVVECEFFDARNLNSITLTYKSDYKDWYWSNGHTSTTFSMAYENLSPASDETDSTKDGLPSADTQICFGILDDGSTDKISYFYGSDEFKFRPRGVATTTTDTTTGTTTTTYTEQPDIYVGVGLRVAGRLVPNYITFPTSGGDDNILNMNHGSITNLKSVDFSGSVEPLTLTTSVLKIYSSEDDANGNYEDGEILLYPVSF